MAQTDTGLNWNAKTDWLRSQAGVICSLSKMSSTYFPNGAIPYGVFTDEASIRAQGVNIATKSSNGYIDTMSITEGAEIFVFRPSTGGLYWVSATQNAKAMYATSQSGYSGGRTVTLNSRDTASGLYYHVLTGGWLSGWTWNCPNTETTRTYMDSFTVTLDTWYKLNPGYAVACVAKFKAANGDFITSPCLISTDIEYVKLSLDGTTEYGNPYITFHRIDGLEFAMALVYGNADFSISSSTVELANLPSNVKYGAKEVFNLVRSLLWSNIIVSESPDPYGDGNTENDGGDGDPEDGEDIDVPDVPTITSTASGFLTLFVPTMYDINRLARYMYSSDFNLDSFKKIFANPIDNIIGLYINAYHASPIDTKEVVVGGIGTGITMPYTSAQFRQLNMGTCTVPREYGSYLDYAPYTKIQVYLPYIGTRELDTDDVMGSTLSIYYNIDLLSGACVANISRDGTVLYSFSGQCSSQIPIGAADMRNAFASAAAVAAALGTAAAAAMTGAALPFATGIATASLNVMGTKPKIARSGSVAGAAGFLAPQTPYLIRTNPQAALPAEQNKYTGYPSFITMPLTSLTGYNEIASIHLEGVPATDAELSEIVNLLQSGVIF